jgi:DNA primase
LESATGEYEKGLDLAAAYLKARGITREMAQKFRLGVCCDPYPEHEAWRGRLTIPYLTMSGPIGLKARCIQFHDCKEAGHGKYLCEVDAAPLLYNTPDLVRDEDTLFVVEGELDAVVLSGGLGFAAVAYPGTASWRPYFNRAIGPDWKSIVVVADGDEAGRDAARSVGKHVRGRVLKLPEGEDVSSLLVKEGQESLRNRLVAFVDASSRSSL